MSLSNLPPDQTIRDVSIPIPTPSLSQAGAEVVPDELVRDLLLREWLETDAAPRPRIIVRDEASTLPVGHGDHLTVGIDDYQETFEGHRHEFVNVSVMVGIEIYTQHSRQRLWDIMAEVRRIIYRWQLALQPYHALHFDGFRPDYVAPRGWQGAISLRLRAEGLPIFLRRVTGEESPSNSPDQFPDGI